MKKEYDLSKGVRKNPYTKMLKSQVTINLSNEVINYFKQLSIETSVPYQTLINFFLLDCVYEDRAVELGWRKKQK